ncbi:hypothetical protein ACO3TA_05170 [Methanocaldococcus sp. 28A]
MKLKVICKDDNFTNDNELCIKCEVCIGKDIMTILELLKEEYPIDEIEIPNCEKLKKILNLN